ncbi:hypothetical protein GDO86_008668 [Hymenochirus boettgeri]|uniref:Sulfotransferase n=1 Tax=Hymenochirus boettgeri TaxID=247094 RepID=A0A8T2J6P0_9PIPI|nr:hypothetical protein GDO86_008668 [Hymenochirus boettgeri]
MTEIVDMIYNSGDAEKCCRDTIYKRVPYIEMNVSGGNHLESLPSPRLMKTHLPFQLMPQSFWEKNCKVIYVARNAKDLAVSYFFFHKILKTLPDTGPWETFLTNFMKGDVSYGSWYDHVKGWWENRHNYQILYLFYEDLKEDPKREIRKVGKFLQRDLSEEVLEKIVYHTSFEKMKMNNMANYRSIPHTLLDQSTRSFMRKGVVSDWENHFTVAQNELFDEDYQRQMSATSLLFRTKI